MDDIPARAGATPLSFASPTEIPNKGDCDALASAQPERQAQPAKRGRGRPRTRPLPDPNAPPKRRGRPPKPKGAPLAPYKTIPSLFATEPLADEDHPADVLRDEHGRWIKGGAPSAGGRTRAQLRVERLLMDATPAAVARIVGLVDSPTEAIAMAAAKFIVERVAAPAKAPSVAVQVNNNNISGPAAFASNPATQDLLLRAQLRARGLDPTAILGRPGPAPATAALPPPVIEDAEVTDVEIEEIELEKVETAD